MTTVAKIPLRTLAWLGFFAAILASWWGLYAMSADMDLDLIGRPGPDGARMAAMDPRMPMYMPMANFGPLFAMWAVMMAAMMLPTLVPTLRSYEDLMVSANGSRAGWIGLIAGYFLVWVAFAGLITGAQLALLYGGVIDMLGIAKSTYVSTALLVVVGLYQFTWIKAACHGVCHAPMQYFMGHWRTGGWGGLRMGLALGAYCVGCCWGFMALGFVGGVMSLLWMGLATAFMIVEKLPQMAHHVTRPAGIILVVAGLLLALQTAFTGA